MALKSRALSTKPRFKPELVRVLGLAVLSVTAPQSNSEEATWWWCSRSVVSDSVTPWTVAYQAPLSMGFSRQEYWSRLPFPSPGDLANSGIKPGAPALRADSLPIEPPGKPSSNMGGSQMAACFYYCCGCCYCCILKPSRQ